MQDALRSWSGACARKQGWGLIVGSYQRALTTALQCGPSPFAMVVLGGGAVSYELGTTVNLNPKP